MKIIIDVKSKLKVYRFEQDEWIEFLDDCTIEGYVAVRLANTKNLKLIPEEQFLYHEVASDGALKITVYDHN